VSEWIILVDGYRDLPQGETIHKVLSTRDYLGRRGLFAGRRPQVVNLARSYAYQSAGYYCARLAEARGHRTIPIVQTILELQRKSLYAHALPELETALARDLKKAAAPPELPFRLKVFFGRAEQAGFEHFASVVFDWFRAPALEVSVAAGEPVRIKRLALLTLPRIARQDRSQFDASLERYTSRRWKRAATRKPVRYSLAVLHNPREVLPPSTLESLKDLATVGARVGFEVEPIQKSEFGRIAEFDALFIRETTSIDGHTYRFARRAEQEGQPVIDDTASMIRCTNKIYLKELLEAHKVPMPRSLVVSSVAEADTSADRLGLPVVVKVPDGSFSRGVHKADTLPALKELLARLFEETDFLLAQAFMPTAFDWRVGVLGGQPLFVCQYRMAKRHWQIIKHEEGGGAPREGGTRTLAVRDAPQEVVDTAVRAAGAIGSGLYGVDLKSGPEGAAVIEVNDNPNMDTRVEGSILRDRMWTALLEWFLARLDAR